MGTKSSVGIQKYKNATFIAILFFSQSVSAVIAPSEMSQTNTSKNFSTIESYVSAESQAPNNSFQADSTRAITKGLMSMANTTDSEEVSPSNGQDVLVTNAEQLMQALSTAEGGAVISLSSGDYGTLSLYDAREAFAKFDSTVTIKSAEPGDPASFGGLELRGVENLRFENVVFDYSQEHGEAGSTRPFEILSSENIEIYASKFDGDVAKGLGEIYDGYGVGIALSIRSSSEVSVIDSEISQFSRGVVVDNSNQIDITGNEIHKISVDGINVAATTDINIENNYIHNHQTHPDNTTHRDQIQFWTAGTDSPSENITIRGNILNSGEGDWTQSIFMRNEVVDRGQAGEEMFYRNLLIEDNLIFNSHVHGINVGEGQNIEIRNNTLIQNSENFSDDLVWVPRISVAEASTNVNVHGNIMPREAIPLSETHTYQNNIATQNDDLNADYFFLNVFSNILVGSDATVADLRLSPVSGLEGYGAAISAFNFTPGEPVGYIADDHVSGLTSQTVLFNAENIYGPEGKIDLTDATVTWDFGDGQTATGVEVAHKYAASENYQVVAQIEFSDRSSAEVGKTIHVRSPILLEINADDGIVNNSSYNVDVAASSGVTLEARDDGSAMRLNEGSIVVGRASELINNVEYTVGFDFNTDAPLDGTLKILNFPSSFSVMAQANGFRILLVTDQETRWISIDAPQVHDGEWHNFAFTFSGVLGEAVVYIDGEEIARERGLDGQVQTGSDGHDLTIGSLSGSTQYGGLIDDVVMVNGVVDITSPLSLKNFRADLSQVSSGDGGGVTVTNTDLGDDLIEGSAGEDFIEPGYGNDIIYAGAGDDTVIVVEDALTRSDLNEIHGEEGIDLLDFAQFHSAIDVDLAGEGIAVTSDSATLEGGEQRTIVEFTDFESVLGSTYADVLAGDDDVNLLQGNAGDDLLYGRRGADTLEGGVGADVLVGDHGDDILRGGDGDDVLNGRQGADSLYGGDGDDILYIDGLDNPLRGGAGFDQIIVMASLGVSVDMEEAEAEVGYGNRGDDWFVGGAERVMLYGNGGDDVLIGGDGDDVLIGRQNADILIGGAGNDDIYMDGLDISVEGGAGIDRLFVQASLAVEIDMEATGFEIVYGNRGDDIFHGSQQNDKIYGGDGDDLLIGNGGDDRLFGEAGDDVLIGRQNGDSLSGGAGDDLLYMDGLDVAIDGGTGTDTLNVQAALPVDIDMAASSIEIAYGNNGDDRFDASGMTDTGVVINGGGGDDELISSAGDDVLIGGTGDDIFVFRHSWGQDRVSGEFTNGVEQIGFGADVLNANGGSLDFGDLTLGEDSNGNALVSIAGGGVDTITIVGFDVAQLDQTDFLFGL